ncbi:hypothetical protein D9615_000782 [Tricholomella constricta]|uniref:DUF6593 domain-containing protein n=1 Tax=Tricholomella constricta TaxID=117010 RepID=A0A8H5HQW9_9AGAR|nr:hypothetical protein D9615_000782 [Tricholomella constricta]
MSGPYVLLQFGDDPFNNAFEDLEGRSAFTVTAAGYNPNTVIKLTREAEWSQQHPSIMGPVNSYFYFGPENAPGYIIYGNNRNTIPMPYFIRQRRDGSTSRYFTSQSGKDYKWRIAPTRMELLDGRTSLAVWELSHPEDEFHARLTVKPPGLPIVTEIVTTLALNRMSQQLQW